MGVRHSSRVADRDALLREARRCFADYRQPVLVETCLAGTEVTVGVFGQGDAACTLGCMEIVQRGLVVLGVTSQSVRLRDALEHAHPLLGDAQGSSRVTPDLGPFLTLGRGGNGRNLGMCWTISQNCRRHVHSTVCE